mgnify:CR=1 FL=1
MRSLLVLLLACGTCLAQAPPQLTPVQVELTNPDGSMAKLPEIVSFAEKNGFPVMSVDDLVHYRRRIAA